jgi:hypothetical protein
MELPILTKPFTSETSTEVSRTSSATEVRGLIQAPKISRLTSPFSPEARHIRANNLSTQSNYTKPNLRFSMASSRKGSILVNIKPNLNLPTKLKNNHFASIQIFHNRITFLILIQHHCPLLHQSYNHLVQSFFTRHQLNHHKKVYASSIDSESDIGMDSDVKTGNDERRYVRMTSLEHTLADNLDIELKDLDKSIQSFVESMNKQELINDLTAGKLKLNLSLISPKGSGIVRKW